MNAYGLLLKNPNPTRQEIIEGMEGKAEAFRSNDWSGKLYEELKPQEPQQIDIKLVPYYAWDNRGGCDMTVWMPVR